MITLLRPTGHLEDIPALALEKKKKLKTISRSKTSSITNSAHNHLHYIFFSSL
jgi:hypothetical protein